MSKKTKVKHEHSVKPSKSSSKSKELLPSFSDFSKGLIVGVCWAVIAFAIYYYLHL